METFKIDTFTEFHELISEYESSNFSFRGQSDSSWELIPKIGRKEYSKLYDEKLAFESWQRYATSHLKEKPKDDWDWLTIAQHHGLATRLLDWSRNPLVALFFSSIDLNTKKDGAVFILDNKATTIITEKTKPFDISFSGVFYPKVIASRVISQRSIFTISHKPTVSFELLRGEFEIKKIIINGNSKPKIQKSLELYNINEYSIYQDLDNLSNYLNRFIRKDDFDKIK